MSVTSVTETYQREGSQNEKWQRSFQRTFLVLTSSKWDGAYAVMQSLPVQLGNFYQPRDDSNNVIEHDRGSFVTAINAKCTEKDGMQWEATVDYSPYNPSIFPANPLSHPIKISWGTVKYERSVDADRDGEAILNSAGDYFDPPVTVDDSRPILRIVRNEASFDPSNSDAFKDTVNAATFYGGDPGTWKVADITAELDFNVDSGTPDGYYWIVTYEFEFRREGWQLKILDQGLKILDSNGDQIPATVGGKDTTSPVLLDGDGHQLASGDDPVFITFDVYEEADFDALSLDPAGAPGQG